MEPRGEACINIGALGNSNSQRLINRYICGTVREPPLVLLWHWRNVLSSVWCYPNAMQWRQSWRQSCLWKTGLPPGLENLTITLVAAFLAVELFVKTVWDVEVFSSLFFFKDKQIYSYFMCIGILPSCMYCTMYVCAWCLQRGDQSPRN